MSSHPRAAGLLAPDVLDGALRARFPDSAAAPELLDVSFLGGEPASLPPGHLESLGATVRAFARERGILLRDGVQSALIGSPPRLRRVTRFASGRVGTSTDPRTLARRIGSAPSGALTYRRASLRGRATTARAVGAMPGAVFVVDRAACATPRTTLDLCLGEARALSAPLVLSTARGVGRGPGSVPDVLPLVRFHTLGVRRWLLRESFPVLPWADQLARFLGLAAPGGLCGHQRDCTSRNLFVDHDGTVSLCQELAHQEVAPPVARAGEPVDPTAHVSYDQRRSTIDPACRVCRWRSPCQGGCMASSLAAGRGLYGRPLECPAWKSVFATFAGSERTHGRDALVRWLSDVLPDVAP